MSYREWRENGVLHISYEPFDCFDWITPELLASLRGRT